MRPRFLLAGAALTALLRSSVPTGAAAMTVQVLGPERGIPGGGITALLVEGGRLFVGTARQGLIVHDLATGRSGTITRKEGLPAEEINSLAFFRGASYAGTSGGIGVQRDRSWEPLTQAGSVVLRNVYLAASPDGKELWAGAVDLSGGVVRFDGETWQFVGGKGRGLFNEVGSFAFGPGEVLMGASSGAVYRVRGPEIVSLQEGFPPANVRTLAERGGTIYAGTNRGLFLWRGTSWDAVRVPGPFSGSAVYALLRSEVDLFVAGQNGLLLLDGKGEARILSGRSGIPEGPVTALAEKDGVLYAATQGGVAVIAGWKD